MDLLTSVCSILYLHGARKTNFIPFIYDQNQTNIYILLYYTCIYDRDYTIGLFFLSKFNHSVFMW